jgi:hypothetical protein
VADCLAAVVDRVAAVDWDWHLLMEARRRQYAVYQKMYS